MPWFFNSHTGKLVHEDPPSPGFFTYEAALHTGTGWHELTVADSATEAQAAANAAQAYPGSPAANSENNTIGGAVNAATGTAGAAAQHALPAFALDVSGISGWFFRGLKILFGGILMIIGVSKLTGVSNAITRAAGKIPEMAVFA